MTVLFSSNKLEFDLRVAPLAFKELRRLLPVPLFVDFVGEMMGPGNLI